MGVVLMANLDTAQDSSTWTVDRRPDRRETQDLVATSPEWRLVITPPPQGRIAARGGILRIAVVGLLPTSVLLLLVLGLVSSGAVTGSADGDRLRNGIESLGLQDVVLLLLCALVLSLILQPFQLALVRLLEGYAWGASDVARSIRGIGIRRQRRRLQRLDDMAFPADDSVEDPQRQLMATIQRHTYYPSDPDDLLPTRLGNALRAAEDRAGQRYGLDTNVCMPRLYPYLSDRLVQVLNDRRNQVDVAVRLCAVLLLATVISAPVLLGDGWWFAVPVATAVLSWVAYRGAVLAAVNYGQALYVAFDLHRFDMLRGLHYPLPPREQEHAFNKELSAFLAGNSDEMSFPYAHPDTPTT
jgi:hypothetical protein